MGSGEEIKRLPHVMCTERPLAMLRVMETEAAYMAQSLQSPGSSLTQQTYTPLYKSDAVAPESPFSRSSSMTAMHSFGSFLSQKSGHSSTSRKPSGQLSTSLSVPNFQGVPMDDQCMNASPDSSSGGFHKAADSLSDLPRKDCHPVRRYSGIDTLSTTDSSEMPQPNGARIAPGSPGSGNGQQLRIRMRSNKERRRSQVEGIDDLQAVLSYNIALQSRATQLEKNLSAKDREIAVLTRELQSLSSSDDKAPAAAATKASATARQPLKAGGEDFVKLGLESQAQRLKQLLTVHDLNNADPYGEGLSEGVVDELRRAVKECWRLAEASFTPPHSALVQPYTASDLPSRQAGWQRMLQALKLGEEQVYEILHWRSVTMAKMQEVQQERQLVVAEMLGLLIPGGLLLHNNSAQDFCIKLSQEGWLPLAKVNLDADAAAKKLAGCLELERKVFAQANAKFLMEVLTPVQACLFMVHAWPAHCDCFGFANVLACKRGFFPQAAQNHASTAACTG